MLAMEHRKAFWVNVILNSEFSQEIQQQLRDPRADLSLPKYSLDNHSHLWKRLLLVYMTGAHRES